MSIFKRLGSKKQKYEFYIIVHSIKTKLARPTQCKVQWKRRKKLSETSEFLISCQDCQVDQTLTMENTIYEKSSGPLNKKAKLLVLIYNSTWKTFGTVVLDLSTYIKIQITEKNFQLQDCVEKDSSICLSILTKYTQDIQKIPEKTADDLINDLNEYKNTLVLKKNEFDQECEELDKLKNELLLLETDLLGIEDVSGSQVNLHEENEKMKLKILEYKEVLKKQKEENEELEKRNFNREKILIEKVKILLETETGQLDEILENIIRKYE